MSESFSVLLTKHQALRVKMFAKADSFQKWINKRELSIYKKYYPKHKKVKLNLLQAIPEIVARRQATGQRKTFRRFWDFWGNKEEQIKKELFDAAQELKPAQTKEFVLFDSISSYNWSSQGFGAMKYAYNAAKEKQDICLAFDVECEIREVISGSDNYGCQYGHYEIWAKTDKIGIEILKRKYLPLVESIRLSWKRGANPRVDKHWLPHGYEEKVGIDYFGKIVNQELYNNALKEN